MISPFLTILLFFVVTMITRECNVVIAQLTPLPGFPIKANSAVWGSTQCTKNSDEIYAVCGSQDSNGVHTAAVKYNLQPFSFAAKRLTSGSIFTSCDLYETTLQSTSRVVCAMQQQQTTSTISFLRVSDMKVSAQIPIAASYFVVVDTPNHVAYVSNYDTPPVIFKIIDIASSSPILVGNVTWGENSADNTPCALLIVGDFLYAHLSMYPSGLARIRISNLTHDRTVMFAFGEDFGQADNLANDNNFIYDLTSGLFEQNGMLVRITYQNNSFARFDHLKTGFTSTFSLSISPDLQTLFIAAQDQNAIILVSTMSFNTIAMTAPVIPSAIGRPVVMTNGIFYAFSGMDDKVWGFNNCYRQSNATFGGPSKIICPAGYFCPDPNATSPTPCGPGKYTPSEGWCSCLLCQEGFLCRSQATVNPEPCPSGFFCPSTISSSLSCPCGAFCPSESTQPSPCQQGTFNPNVGSASNTSCEPCSAEEYCPVASCSPASCSCGMHCSVASRTNCTPGYYNSDPSFFCSLCPEGFFCPSETTCSPIPCAENQFCPPGSSQPSNTVLLQLPNSPISTDSGVVGSMQCTKSSDESYAVCGSNFGGAIKYNLQPFSFALRSGLEGSKSMSCDLYETSFQSTSRVVCAQQTPAAILFLQVSDMTQAASVSLPNAFYAVVDAPNEVAYVTNFNIPATICKIINIASSTPILAGNVTWGQNSGDQHPAALLIIGEFLYNHLAMNPARLARIRISNFSHDTTIEFIGNEGGGSNDNLANDNTFIYDLTQFGKVVRCTYQNNNFARFDSLSTGFTATNALSISPDLQTLFFSSWGQNTVDLVDVATFTQTVSTGPAVPSAAGRPIVMSNGIFYAFSLGNDQVYGFKYCPLIANYNGSSKILCPAGYFCPDPNATAPTPCSPGTYSPSTGFCFCPFCPPGAFCPSASTITPQNCPVGTYNENNGASSIAACLPCPLGKICQEGCITPIDCNRQNCYSTRNCTMYSKVLVGVTNAKPYCVVSNRSSCTSPLTCSSINLPAYDIRLQCEAAGCRYSGSNCVNRDDCFNLFLPSFVIQPLGLMFIGFAKDVIVLLLIGIFGDVFMRKVKTMMLPFNFWKKKWNRDQIKVSMETTIFANDANCRNETSTKQESFEEYCERIAIALFELPEIDDDEEMRKDWKRKLVDAITFSMFDFGLWFEVDEIDEENNDNNEQDEIIQQNEEVNEQQEETETNEQTNTSKHALSAKDEESEQRKDGNDDVQGKNDESKEVVNDEKQPDEKNEEETQDEKNGNEEPRLQQNQTITTSPTLKCDEEETTIQESQPNRKMVLSSESFATTSTLQQFVNVQIFSNAQRVVYFASSRDWKVRAASALNNFPSTIQLFYYISSVIIFVAFTFRDVVLDSYNQNIIGQVSNFTCGNAEKHSQSKTTYLLLGFRFLNSSSTATVILIFIKTLHAIYSSSSTKFEKLQLPQRLPILGLLTSKSTQILLIFYFLVVASFALAGVTYGLHIVPSLVVVSIAALLLIFDSAILKFVRAFISKSKARQDAHRDKVLEQVATQELPFLGLNADERNEREALTAGGRRSLYTEGDPLVEHEEFDFITADEAFEAAKQSVLNPESNVSLPQALLVFLLREEIPTIILTITLQLCFNYICLLEFGEAFGVADQWQLPNMEYEARKFDCIWGMFESDVSSKISVLTSFVGFL